MNASDTPTQRRLFWRWSLRRRLLFLLLVPLGLVIGGNAFVGYQQAKQATNDAYDRSLYLAARTLAEELTWREGRLELNVLRGTGYLFENHIGSRLFYQVLDERGALLSGDPLLPALRREGPATVQFFALVRFEDASHRGQPVRMAELTHVAEDAPPQQRLVRVVVAETLEARRAMVQRLWVDTLYSQALVLLTAATLVVLAVQTGMRPLEALRRRLQAKDDMDFTPVSLVSTPRELDPLIQAINSHRERLGRLIDIRKRFIDNAAHQLRTPLTILKTQMDLAARLPHAPEADAVLQAARRTTEQATHLTEQLLALTRAEHSGELNTHTPVDLVALSREVVGSLALPALQAGHDLGLEAPDTPVQVPGVQRLLREALSNLVDNAICHTPEGSRITVRVGPGWVEVEDNGPGIEERHRPHVFERFYRGAPAERPGSGLGLAIVKEIASQHGASVTLQHGGADAPGLRVRLAWPAQPVPR